MHANIEASKSVKHALVQDRLKGNTKNTKTLTPKYQPERFALKFRVLLCYFAHKNTQFLEGKAMENEVVSCKRKQDYFLRTPEKK